MGPLSCLTASREGNRTLLISKNMRVRMHTRTHARETTMMELCVALQEDVEELGDTLPAYGCHPALKQGAGRNIPS